MRDTTTGRQYENNTSLPHYLTTQGWKQHPNGFKSPCKTLTATFHSKTQLHAKNGLLANIEAPNRNKVSVKRQPDEAMLIAKLVGKGFTSASLASRKALMSPLLIAASELV